MLTHIIMTVALSATLSVPNTEVSSEAQRVEIVNRGLDYLRDKGQEGNGSFSPRVGSGITSLAVTAALRNGVPISDKLVAQGLKFLESKIQTDGGIYASDRLRNYETCVGIMAFAEANRVAGDRRYDTVLKNAEKFVRGLQIGVGGDVDQSNPYYGGVGYSGKERPDLSNTAFLIEALHSLETPSSDPAIQRALLFVSRCQNLDAEWNDTQFADKVNDGGFYYVVPTEKVDPSTSERYTTNGGLRSYGSMTYAGFKSLIYAGLNNNDPRAKVALEWISKNYSLDRNPGQGLSGLFYYYHTFGSALDASGLDVISTPGGEQNWRADLITTLSKSQRANGSWVNSDQQWFESDANLCTAFALLSLAHAKEVAK